MREPLLDDFVLRLDSGYGIDVRPEHVSPRAAGNVDCIRLTGRVLNRASRLFCTRPVSPVIVPDRLGVGGTERRPIRIGAWAEDDAIGTNAVFAQRPDDRCERRPAQSGA